MKPILIMKCSLRRICNKVIESMLSLTKNIVISKNIEEITVSTEDYTIQ